VLLPHSDTIGISARIEDEDERERLRAMVEELLEEQDLKCGAIVRKVAEGTDKETPAADLRY